MSRCYICDFSNDQVESLYGETLQLRRTRQNRVRYDTILGKDICDDCRDWQKDDPHLEVEDAYDAYLEGLDIE